MKYNAKWKRWVTKDGLVFRTNEHSLKHEEPKLIYCEMKPHPKSGYVFFSVKINGVRKATSVHRLVWETFNGEIPVGYEIDHIDGNKQNNALSNLRCVTHIENLANPNTIKLKRKIYDSVEWRNNVSEGEKGKPKKPTTEFARRYKEKFGDGCVQDMNSYKVHYNFFKKHGYCKWEVEDAAN